MKEKFREYRPSKERIQLLGRAISIVEEYEEQNIRMTLRQLYYQLVARDFLPNTIKEYKKLSELLTSARYAGYVDWEAIEDRIRVPKKHAEWDDVTDLVESAKHSYRLDRWEGQEYYLELFTEKDALASVLSPIADKWHIHFCVNRGYTSASAMYDLYKRVDEKVDEGKKVRILYLGDYDPSGLDMVRDIKIRMSEMLLGGFYDKSDYKQDPEVHLGELLDDDKDLDVVHIALTKSQIEEYNPPPNPAKLTDPRAKDYIRRHGRVSWEVDALRPEVMMGLVNDSIRGFVDEDMMEEIKDKEKEDMKQLEEFAKTLAGEE